MRSEPKKSRTRKTVGSRQPRQLAEVVRDADHKYFSRHFTQLVREHGGQWIVLVDANLIGIANKNRLASLVKKARTEYPGRIPFIAPIPTKDDIECVL